MRDVTVQSWTEVQECLFADSWQPALGRFRSNFVFRGMSRVDYSLETSLMRLCKGNAELEEHLLRTFRRYAHRYAVPADSIWNWLAVAQHHLLPTRLLDWSYSPYVALHFVTANLDAYDEDGIVLCVDFSRTNAMLPDALRQLLQREGATVFTVDMLTEVAATLRAFDALADEGYVAFFEPPSIDDRIVNQFALFSLMSSPTARLDQWLESHPDSFRRILIPARLKWEIRDKLDQANITERVLFPGLDGLSAWLKRYYLPRDPADCQNGTDPAARERERDERGGQPAGMDRP
jgi:hypothetical protein